MKVDDFVDQLATKIGCSKVEARKIMGAFKDVVRENVKKGEEISIPDFGKFSRGERAARNGINPATKKPIKIEAKTVAKFKPSSKFFD